jgi:hypothetical protein
MAEVFEWLWKSGSSEEMNEPWLSLGSRRGFESAYVREVR